MDDLYEKFKEVYDSINNLYTDVAVGNLKYDEIEDELRIIKEEFEDSLEEMEENK